MVQNLAKSLEQLEPVGLRVKVAKKLLAWVEKVQPEWMSEDAIPF